MKKETIQQAKTVEAAVAQGAKELGADVSAVTYEILEEARKGLFGIGAAPAKVRVTYTETPDEMALSFVKTLLADMELNAEAVMTAEEDGRRITVSGENAGVLIGHHGDTLDAIQYLANLAANRGEEDDHSYMKITVDVENYRAKREETLRQLAVRMTEKVLKYNKSITLEPMNPYERRIIHSEVQKIEGVSTNSIGAENNRRIVIFPTQQPDAKDGHDSREVKEPREKRQYTQDTAEQASADGENTEKRGGRNDRYADRNGSRNGRGGRGGRGRGRGDRQSNEVISQPNRPLKTVDKAEEEAAAELNAPLFERAKAEKEAAAAAEPPKAPSGPRSKKPYYMRPKNAPGTQRTYAKPVKKDSVESYYFDLENSMSGLTREKEEPSDIAKACGIYDDPVTETPDSKENTATAASAATAETDASGSADTEA
ncbi:MAG: RNA-binding cell elongation regulator Jag/EloR [Eubacteriales bacterium]